MTIQAEFKARTLGGSKLHFMSFGDEAYPRGLYRMYGIMHSFGSIENVVAFNALLRANLAF